jgi:hypothetical protein
MSCTQSFVAYTVLLPEECTQRSVLYSGKMSAVLVATNLQHRVPLARPCDTCAHMACTLYSTVYHHAILLKYCVDWHTASLR